MSREEAGNRALASWSPVTIAQAVDRGLIDVTPLGFTPAGWKWLKELRTRRGRIDQQQ